MPQTKESIKYCENAGVPIIIAVNKMDKPGANPDNVKRELTEFNLMPEDWGGQTQYVHVSALKGTGIDELKNQLDVCESCNRVAKTKNTSNTFNSVFLRYKKLQLDGGKIPTVA